MVRPLLLLTSLLPVVTATWNINVQADRNACQKPSQNPLDGCDLQRTKYVRAGNSTSKARGTGGSTFSTVQSAVESLPDNDDAYYIVIAAGNYHEQVNITRRGPTYLLGQTSSPQSQAANTVNIIWKAVADNRDNVFTSALVVAPNLESSLIGSGPTGYPVPPETPFGCRDFRTYNLNIINDYLPYTAGPSLAVSISYANAGFYYTGIFSYQDTLYVGKLGNVYASKSTVGGQTDFIFGFGTAWLSMSQIQLRSCGGGIVAWKGSNTTFENKYGAYIVDSTVEKANSSLSIKGKCALGRPWNGQARAIFARTLLDDSINPNGYIDWKPTRYIDNAENPKYSSLQAEYKTHGPGFNAAGRAAALFGKQLDDKAWAPYSTPALVFQDINGKFGNIGWIDFKV